LIVSAICVAALASTAAGLVGWLATGESRFLLLCLPALLFLS
jgi:hypothetical protein